MSIRSTVWISVQEAAHRLDVSHMTVRAWVANKKLRGQRLRPFKFTVVDAASVAKVAKERARAR